MTKAHYLFYGQGVKTYYSTTSKNRYASPYCSLFDEWNYENIELSYKGNNSFFSDLYIKYKSPTDFKVYRAKENIGYTTTRYLHDTSFHLTEVNINGSNYKCLKLAAIPPDTSAHALFNLNVGIIQLIVDSKIWTLKILK